MRERERFPLAPKVAEKMREEARARYQHAAGMRSPASPEFAAALNAYWADLRHIKDRT